MLIRSLTRGRTKSVIDELLNKHRRPYSTGAVRRLEGKVALITGGASGIGKATAQEFIEQGARVMIADKDSLLGAQVARELGSSAQFVECDVGVEAQIEEAIKGAVDEHGKLDVMYNNAGIVGALVPPGVTELDLDEFDKVMRINVRGTIAGIKHAARVMIPRGSGSILCTSSISGLMGGLGTHPYTISKFTIPGIVKAVATELCQNGVRLNCISPGPIATPLVVTQIANYYPGATYQQLVEIVNGLGKLKGTKCETIDIAKAALYLASDEAKYITGHNLVVDGGFTCFKTLDFPSPDQIV
ncbi:hypothetical protein K2173_004060 [Erythroxylum novogranatense]|uniref:Uncharacterized protein n=1 Tax=Erythroxylum novogranatense TaxID=1862640 RepID=A0AAV8SK37_9ROSI|nr:hypothetical protein K2173_004060 [Erythroxylum novogranatense]